MNRVGLSVLFLVLALPLGCASNNNEVQSCTIQGFGMIVEPKDPTQVAPYHTLAPPGNQEAFLAAQGSTYGPGCFSNHLFVPVPAQWTTSDPLNVSISSANDATNGVATCTGITNATVTATLTAADFTESRSATITCK